MIVQPTNPLHSESGLLFTFIAVCSLFVLEWCMSTSGRKGHGGGSSRAHHGGRHHKHNQQQGSAPNAASTTKHRVVTDTTTPAVTYNTRTLAGLVVVQHKPWPVLPNQVQSELFFECTLFLYSVLALFLNYLNLYKTLWWLPKSHWHHSIKLHLVNPYLLSCIGLLLGCRVTKCFYNTISERVDNLCVGQKGLPLTSWRIVEYAFIKTPLATIVVCSFLFSFSRIFTEFGVRSLFFFTYPFIIYTSFFNRRFHAHWVEIITKRWKKSRSLVDELWQRVEELGNAVVNFDSYDRLLNLSSTTTLHLCVDDPERTKEEARILWTDCLARLKHCVFAGLFTAYFAVFMPRVFIPERSQRGEPQHLLVNDVWTAQLCLVVAMTSFSIYATHLFPIHYFDLLHRCAVHLGSWKKLTISRPNGLSYLHDNAVDFAASHGPMADGTVCTTAKGDYYQAQSHADYNSVSADPENDDHRRLFSVAKDAVLCSTYMCCFQALLVGVQFWMLILTSDWQHIATLVLLMFANYMHLWKVVKDRVIIGRVYRPSVEDQQLPAKLLLEENGNSA